MAHGNVILTSSVDSHLPCPVGECLANVLIRLLKTIDERIANLRVVSGCQEKELLWPTNRERLQEHRVHQAENGGVRADAECQRKNRNGGEAGILQQLPERKPQVTHMSG